MAESYEYDALGRRVSVSDGTTTNYLIYDGIHVIAEVGTSSLLVRSYTWGPGIDNPLAMSVYTNIGGTTSMASVFFYLKDHLGSVRALTDTNGVVVESYQYDAWGNVLDVLDGQGNSISNQQSQIGNRILWQGREYSWKTGLCNFRARWYDPVTARWLSKDPIGISGGLNQYVFVGNNPVNFTDPYGLLTWSQVGHFAAGVAVGAGVAVVVVVAAPVVASAGAAALVAAGVSAATAGTIATATVTAGLGVGAVWGASTTAGRITGNVEAHNWDAVAFDVGTLTGGAVVGGLGGGRSMGGGVSGRPSTVPRSWNPLTADRGYGFVRNPELPLPTDLFNWLGTGPTPSSAGGAATLIGSGMAGSADVYCKDK